MLEAMTDGKREIPVAGEDDEVDGRDEYNDDDDDDDDYDDGDDGDSDDADGDGEDGDGDGKAAGPSSSEQQLRAESQGSGSEQQRRVRARCTVQRRAAQLWWRDAIDRHNLQKRSNSNGSSNLATGAITSDATANGGTNAVLRYSLIVGRTAAAAAAGAPTAGGAAGGKELVVFGAGCGYGGIGLNKAERQRRYERVYRPYKLTQFDKVLACDFNTPIPLQHSSSLSGGQEV